MATTLDIPAPPEGFELDEEIPPPPEGFQLDVPEETPQAAPEIIPPSFTLKEPFNYLPGGMNDPGDQAAGLREIVSNPIDFSKSIPSIVIGAATAPGKLAYQSAADVISAATGQKEYGGNLSAAMERGPDNLPVDKFLAEVSKTNPNLAVVGKTGKGLAELAPLAAVGMLPAAAARLLSAGFTVDMILHAPEQARELGAEMGKPESEQDKDKITTLQSGLLQTAAFAPLTGRHAVGEHAITRGDFNRLAGRELSRQVGQPIAPRFELEQGTEAAATPGMRELGIRVPEGPFANPEIPALADAALREAQQRIIIPGQEGAALAELRRAIEPPQIQPVTIATAERPGGGEARFGKESFMREAEAPTPERTQAVSAAEKSMLQKFVDEEAAQGAVFEQKNLPEGVSYRRPSNAPTPEEYQKRLEKESVEQGLTQDSGFYLDEPFRQSLPEPAPQPERVREGVSIVSPGTGRAIEKPIPLSALQRSRLRAALARGANEQTIKNILRLPEKQPSQPQRRKPKVEPPTESPLQENAQPTETVTAQAVAAKTSRPEQPDIAESPVPPVELTPTAPVEKVRVGNNPQPNTIVERLPQSAIEKANGEQPIRVKNDKTGEESVVMESDLTPIKMSGEKSDAPTATQKLNQKIEDAGLDPKDFPNKASKQGIIKRLESLKLKENDAGIIGAQEGLQSGLNIPHPEAIKAIGRAAWNTAIDIAIAGIKAGKSVKLAIEDAMSHIRKNASGKFDDAQVRLNLDSILAPEKESTATPGTTGDKTKMRTLSERGTTSEKIPEPVQEQIKGSPESYYQQQSLKNVESAARAKTDSELATTPKESDTYTADKLEQITRLFDSGQSDAGYRAFQDLAAEGTRLGQIVNQFKLFQALRPEHVVTVVNKDLVKAERDPLTLEQSKRVEDAAAGRIKAQSELNKATDAWTKEPTDANAAKAETALEKSNEAALAEQRLVNQFQPRTTPSILKAILQGNLLTPISQVANIVGNVNFSPFRSATRTIASSFDILDSYLSNRPRQISSAPLAGTKASVQGLIKGVKEIPAILAKGTGEAIKGETRAGLHPLRAWVKQFSKNPDVPTIDGKIPFSERVNLAIEGTFGVPAEIMLRGLGAGDIAFTEMARSRLIQEQARLAKLTPEQSRMAAKFPELFFDKAKLEQISNETRGAVFQRHSKTLDHFTSAIKGKGDWFDLLVATVAPYKLTPWNIVGEILSYNPLIAMGKTALEAKRGNKRVAEINAAKVIVGSTLVYAGNWLYQNGLIAPSMDSKDEQQKARVLAGEVLPPNHINVSGLKRKLEGGDGAFKPGDETVDVFRGGGLAGSMFYMMANIGRDAETKPATDEVLLSLLKNSTLEQARFGLNQSFLKGVAGLLDAVRDGEGDSYLQSYAGTVLSVPLPNTLSTLSRAERQYRVETKGDTIGKQLENVVRTRLGFMGLDDYLPLKRGLWGEPLPETPKDRNALLYHFFDISKNRQVTSDPVPLELYRLWRKTANTSVIPSPPEKTLTAQKETYVLNSEQRSRLAELVGSSRKEIVEQLVVNPEWHERDDDQKISVLQKAYERGLKIGKAQFMEESGDKLEKKAVRAGFKQ